jgi:hypothetical protein
MTRPISSRITATRSPEKAPAAEPAAPAAAAPPTETPPKMSWAWRLTIVLWLTSFGLMFLYEVMSSVLRGLGLGRR